MFLEEVLEKSYRFRRGCPERYYSERAIRKNLKQQKRNVCCFCGKNIVDREISLEHTIPQIILRMGGREEKFDIAHEYCNSQNNQISNAIGIIVKSPHMSAIIRYSRYICDLVRKQNDSIVPL